MHACEAQWTILGAAPREPSTLSFFETGLLAGLEFTSWARLTGQQAIRFHLSNDRTISMSYSTRLFYGGSRDGTRVFMLAKDSTSLSHLPSPTFLS